LEKTDVIVGNTSFSALILSSLAHGLSCNLVSDGFLPTVPLESDDQLPAPQMERPLKCGHAMDTALASTPPASGARAAAKRVLAYDALNIFACFGVIAIHCNGTVNDYGNIALLDWLQTLVISMIFMACVPLFFMLSGATLLNYRQRCTTKEFFRRRLLRAVVPFLLWSLIAFAWALRSGLYPTGIQDFLSGILNTRFMAPYWFFLPLFSVYLAMPVLSLLADNRRVLWYMAVAGFVTIFVLPPTLRLVGADSNDLLEFPLTGGGYVVYAIVGYLLATAELGRSRRALIYGLGFGSVVFACVATVFLTMRRGSPDHAFWEYLYWPSLLFSSAVFVLFQQIRWERLFASERSRRALSVVAAASLGVYLVHVYGINAVSRLSGLDAYSLSFRLLTPFAVYLGGLLIVLALKRVPVLKGLVP
jgi:surface polysaccharide O-acyltransferase-like enzyme